MRITAGIHKGRTLISPEGKNTRPTSDKARLSIFNILRHGNWHDGVLEGAHVLDVFAGTGAMGLEALSQGAHHAIFIERDPMAASVCVQNIAQLKEQHKTALLKFDATDKMPRPLYIKPCNLIFLDPPYGKDMGAAALTMLAEQDWLLPNAICVLEMAKKVPEKIPSGFTIEDERSYGIAQVSFLRFIGG